MIELALRTARLHLRPWSFRDVSDVVAFADDAEWGRHLPVPHPYCVVDAERFVATQMLLDKAHHLSWAIEFEGRAVGAINLRFHFEQKIGEMGFSIARPLWGRGMTTEAARAVIDHAFRNCADLTRIRASAALLNVASQRVLEKAGLKREGLLRGNRFVRGQPVDDVWFGVLRSEWSGNVDSAP